VQAEVLNLLQSATIAQFDFTTFQLAANEDCIKFLPPKFENVLTHEEELRLHHFYQQLNPNVSIQTMSVFYTMSKKIAFVNDLIKLDQL